MSAPGAGKTSLLERVVGDVPGVRVGVLEGDVQGSIDADRLAGLHVPVTQLNTDPGFGGECHLDANMVRSALDCAAAAGDRPARDRERGQPRLPGRVQGRRGRARDGLLGHRGRGQAAEVPADVPHLRPGAGQQDRPAAPPGLRPRPLPLQPRPGASRRCSGCSSAPAPARASRRGATGWPRSRQARARGRPLDPTATHDALERASRRAARSGARWPTASSSPRRPSDSRASATGWPSASRAAVG